jgi:hypothetical protein
MTEKWLLLRVGAFPVLLGNVICIFNLIAMRMLAFNLLLQ